MSFSISLQLENLHTVHFHLGKKIIENSSWSDDTVKLSEFWKPNTKICMSSNVNNDRTFRLPPTKEEFNIGLLKSALQKAIRRRKSDVALNIAWQLLCQDKTEFLRRLPVIIMEDSFLHPDFPLLVWLMIADSKGWSMSKSQVQILMRLVWDTAEGKYRDHFASSDEEFANPLLGRNVGKYDSYVACIILRANYGGMKGDIEFLKAFSLLWHNRFNSDEQIWIDFWKMNYPENQKVDNDILDFISKQPYLKDSSKLLEGIDQHTFPMLLDQCRVQLNQFIDKETIGKAVWYHSSGVNRKDFATSAENPMILEFSTLQPDQGYLESLETWNIIKSSWINLCDIKFWDPIPLEHKTNEKKRKVVSNEKITKFFKFK